jgi:hypothetical protein
MFLFILDVDDCDPNPCLNHGKCVDAVDDYICECPRGFVGENCDESKELFVTKLTSKRADFVSISLFDYFVSFQEFWNARLLHV